MRRGVLGLWFVVCGLNLLAMSLSVQQLHIFAEDSSYEIRATNYTNSNSCSLGPHLFFSCTTTSSGPGPSNSKLVC